MATELQGVIISSKQKRNRRTTALWQGTGTFFLINGILKGN